jgi:hypothetical protein
MTDPDVDLRRSEPQAATEDDEPSLGELFGELSRGFSQLVRQEIELAKTEVREEAGKAGKALGQLTGAAVTGHMCLLIASLAAAWALGEIIPVAVGLLIVAAIHGIVAAVLYTRGRRQAAEIDPIPDETIDTLKEDARWARAQPR